MSALTHRDWKLASAVLRLVDSEHALTERQLAERLGTSPSDVHRVAGMLIGRHKLGRAGNYLVPPKAGAE